MTRYTALIWHFSYFLRCYPWENPTTYLFQCNTPVIWSLLHRDSLLATWNLHVFEPDGNANSNTKLINGSMSNMIYCSLISQLCILHPLSSVIILSRRMMECIWILYVWNKCVCTAFCTCTGMVTHYFVQVMVLTMSSGPSQEWRNGVLWKQKSKVTWKYSAVQLHEAGTAFAHFSGYFNNEWW